MRGLNFVAFQHSIYELSLVNVHAKKLSSFCQLYWPPLLYTFLHIFSTFLQHFYTYFQHSFWTIRFKTFLDTLYIIQIPPPLPSTHPVGLMDNETGFLFINNFSRYFFKQKTSFRISMHTHESTLGSLQKRIQNRPSQDQIPGVIGQVLGQHKKFLHQQILFLLIKGSVNDCPSQEQHVLK